MHAIVTALADQQAALAGLLGGLDEPDWRRPSRCEGWSVADVVLHLAQTNELAVASAEGRFAEGAGELGHGAGPAGSIDEAAEVVVARDRALPPSAIHQRWRASADSQCNALARCNPSERLVWVAGELSARTLATTRLSETWIHTDDVATAFGPPFAPTDRLWHVARLAWRTLPYAFAGAGLTMAGPVAFELRGPGGDAWSFMPDDEPLTVIRGDATELCLVAARRLEPGETGLQREGPDGDAVLELVRTYA